MNLSVSSSAFKAHCLEYIAKAQEKNAQYIVTKRGKPVAKLIPIYTELESFEFGRLKGSATAKGNIISPIETSWEVLK